MLSSIAWTFLYMSDRLGLMITFLLCMAVLSAHLSLIMQTPSYISTHDEKKELLLSLNLKTVLPYRNVSKIGSR